MLACHVPRLQQRLRFPCEPSKHTACLFGLLRFITCRHITRAKDRMRYHGVEGAYFRHRRSNRQALRLGAQAIVFVLPDAEHRTSSFQSTWRSDQRLLGMG